MRRLLFTALATSLAQVSLSAEETDEVNLLTGDHFKGKVVKLTDGIIQLKSAHSKDPLRIKNKALSRINFADTSTEDLPKNSQQLILRNGDAFPGTLTALSDTAVTFDTWFAGPLEIPRNRIELIYFGVTPQRTLYQGPDNTSSWTQESNARWRFTKGDLTSREIGHIGRDFSLPEDFIVRFRIAWSESPKLRIHLCTDKVRLIQGAAGSSYRVDLNTAGVQLARSMPPDAVGHRNKTLTQHPMDIRSLNPKEIELELRVSRKDRSITLYVNNEELTQAIDPSSAPTGSGIILQNLSNGSTLRILEMQIQEWDAKTHLRGIEERADEKTDTLAVEDGDRFSGQLLSYDSEAEQPIFRIKTPFSDEPVAIPLANSSVLYFTAGKETEVLTGEYRLDLRSGGGLTLSGISLGKEKLAATHPWLGALSLDRRIMNSISQSDPKKARQD